jgi:orotate phosphoribosyltransferase
MTNIQEILEETGAVLSGGHFVYTSGLHGDTYVNKDAVYSDVVAMQEIGYQLALALPWRRAQVVLGPAVGGALLSQWVAYTLSARQGSVLAAYADKEGDGFVIKRGYDKLVAGKRVLIVEDILNTGGSAQKTVLAARAAGAEVIGVAAIVNRGGVTAESLGVPSLHSLLDVTLQTYHREECPLCRDGVPVNTEIGHGAAFVQGAAAVGSLGLSG